jgi:hypothetical protein
MAARRQRLGSSIAATKATAVTAPTPGTPLSRPDAAAVMAELDSWFEDYNEMHPHRAIGMRCPRQFSRAHQPANCPV